MTNGNGAPVDDGRKCWGSARERERRRARFHIRERVVQDQLRSTSSSSSSPWHIPTNPHQIQQYIGYIKAGDRSKFSLSELDRNFDVISARIPISFLDNNPASEPRESSTTSLRDHSLQLCTAWFGVDYARSLEEYFKILETFTFMEYAVWMGKFSVVGSLLVAGVNPCVSAHVQGHEHNAKEEEEESTLQHLGTRVMKRFFHCFPLPLSTYIVKRFVELQWASTIGRQAHGKQACTLCKRHPSKLLFFEPCQHHVCHVCFWQDIIDHIDGRGDYSDVVVCPFCEASCSTHHGRVSLDCGDAVWTELSPPERCRLSLALFQNLPLDRAGLKKVTGKKKKLPEPEHWSSTWNGAVSPSLGSSQAVRHDKFWYFLERNSIYCMRGCLFAGVDINWRNEYGQTALYVSAWRDNHVAVLLLLGFGADPTLSANDGSTPLQIAMACGHRNVGELLCQVDQQEKTVPQVSLPSFPPTVSGDPPPPEASTLIPLEMDHPGAGSYTIDGAFSADQVDWLLNLHRRLPVDVAQKKKAGLCSDRSYFCDSEGGLRRAIQQAIVRSPLGSTIDQVHVFAHMRFLHYSSVGTTLNPHVDICRTDPLTGLRSTHTLIAYLTDCDQGGATSLLVTVSGEGRNDVLARVMPQRGRLLLFPHACPHEGNEVIDVPKIILRGEVFLGEPRVGKHTG
jgi:Ankyrin repeats (many copies)/2OG-Fe(II) oxygenase superfamily